MNEFDRLNAKKLAQAHRRWLEGLLMRELQAKMDLYEETFEHGYGHGFEDRKKEEEKE